MCVFPLGETTWALPPGVQTGELPSGTYISDLSLGTATLALPPGGKRGDFTTCSGNMDSAKRHGFYLPLGKLHGLCNLGDIQGLYHLGNHVKLWFMDYRCLVNLLPEMHKPSKLFMQLHAMEKQPGNYSVV